MKANKGMIAVLEAWMDAEADYKVAQVASAKAEFGDVALEAVVTEALDRAYAFRGVLVSLVDGFADGRASDIRAGIA